MKSKLLNSFAFGLITCMAIACGASGKNSQKSITSVVVPNEFVSTWRVGDASFGDGDLTVTLPLRSGFNYNFTVDWGDGTTSEVTTHDDVDIDHDYDSAGDYQIKITGLVEAWYFNSTGDKDKIISVQELGSVGWKNFDSAFSGCSKLTTFSGGDTSNVTSMARMFLFASQVTPDTANWDTSNVTDMDAMFAYATAAQPNTSTWNTSKVTSMLGMFNSASVANPDTSGWNTSSVTNMKSMFFDALVATPDTSGWDTSNVTDMSGMFWGAYVATPDTSGWNTSNVTDMSGIFRNADAATPDTSGWDTSNVTDMSWMFRGADNAAPDTSGWNTSNVTLMDEMFQFAGVADPDMSGWDFSSVTSMDYFFASTSNLSTANYDNLLIRLNATAGDGLSLRVGFNTYYTQGGAAEAARTNLDTTKNWTILDGGGVP